MQAIHAAAAASHRAAQFAALVPALRQVERAAQRPAARHVRPSYAQQMRARIQSCTRQMSTVQAEQQKASFLAGVDVQEISLGAWLQANYDFQPCWFN